VCNDGSVKISLRGILHYYGKGIVIFYECRVAFDNIWMGDGFEDGWFLKGECIG